MSNSIQRIKFDRNSMSESAAAFLPHVRLVLSHYPTKMRHRFKRRLSAASNLIHALCVLSMSKFGSAKEKEETWPYLSQCNLNILQHILLHCQPSPPRSTGGHVLAKLTRSSLNMFVHHIKYFVFKTISAGRHTRQYQF